MFHPVVISFLWFSWVHWLVNKHRLTEDSEDGVLFPSKSFKCSFLSVPFLCISSLTTLYIIQMFKVARSQLVIWCCAFPRWRRVIDPHVPGSLNVSNHEGAEIQHVLLPQTQQHDPSSSVVGKTDSFPFLVAQMDLFYLVFVVGMAIHGDRFNGVQWSLRPESFKQLNLMDIK